MKTYNKNNNKMTVFLRGMLLMVLGVLISCQDLEEEVLSDLTPESYFQSISDLDAALMASYAALQGSWGQGFASASAFVPLMGSDDLTTHPASNKQPFREFDIYAGSASNERAKALYNGFYRSIIEANNVIANYEQVDAPQAAKEKAAGQAYFLRGMSYFYLTQLYGKVPLQTSPEVDLELTRSPVAEVYDLVISDLQQAEQFLPNQMEDPGRPNKGAAKAYLAKAYLTMGGWPLKDQSKFALAAQKAKEVIDNADTYGYKLLENFEDLWLLENKNHDEGIFTIQYCLTCGGQHRNHIAGKSGQPVEEAGWTDFFAEINFFNEFPEGPRKEATFYTMFKIKQSDGSYEMVHWDSIGLRHPYYRKWRDGGIDESAPETSTWNTGRNIVLLRYAEVLLIYAEAQARANGPDESAYNAINQVRNRAGLDNLEGDLSQNEFVDKVIQERAWEFAAEFTRWFDLVRTERVEEAAANRHPREIDLPGTVNKDDYLAPIPDTEILINDNLTQNPGY